MCSGLIASVTWAPSSAFALTGNDPKAVYDRSASPCFRHLPSINVLSPMKVAVKQLPGCE